MTELTVPKYEERAARREIKSRNFLTQVFSYFLRFLNLFLSLSLFTECVYSLRSSAILGDSDTQSESNAWNVYGEKCTTI